MNSKDCVPPTPFLSVCMIRIHLWKVRVHEAFIKKKQKNKTSIALSGQKNIWLNYSRQDFAVLHSSLSVSLVISSAGLHSARRSCVVVATMWGLQFAFGCSPILKTRAQCGSCLHVNTAPFSDQWTHSTPKATGLRCTLNKNGISGRVFAYTSAQPGYPGLRWETKRDSSPKKHSYLWSL